MNHEGQYDGPQQSGIYTADVQREAHRQTVMAGRQRSASTDILAAEVTKRNTELQRACMEIGELNGLLDNLNQRTQDEAIRLVGPLPPEPANSVAGPEFPHPQNNGGVTGELRSYIYNAMVMAHNLSRLLNRIEGA